MASDVSELGDWARPDSQEIVVGWVVFPKE
jgi:hypothetical protein